MRTSTKSSIVYKNYIKTKLVTFTVDSLNIYFFRLEADGESPFTIMSLTAMCG